MVATLMYGKPIAEEIISLAAYNIKKHNLKPRLDVIFVGDGKESLLYIGLKEKACKRAGIEIKKHIFSKATTDEIINLIKKLNKSKATNGVMVQLPLPSYLDKTKILMSIDPSKDVDFLNPMSVGKILTTKMTGPCTPVGMLKMFEKYNINVEGKDVVIINNSDLIGKPLALSLLKMNATVTVCNQKTQNLYAKTKKADIVISATGVPGIIKGRHLKRGVVVVDIGIKKIKNQIFGDVDFKSASKKASYLTPVPGGVGPVTVAMLVHNMWVYSA